MKNKHFLAYGIVGMMSLIATVSFAITMETFKDTLAGLGAAAFAVIAVDLLRDAKLYYKPRRK